MDRVRCGNAKKQIIRSGGTILSDTTVTKNSSPRKESKKHNGFAKWQRNFIDRRYLHFIDASKRFDCGNERCSKNIQRIANGLPYRDFLTIGLLVKKVHFESQPKIKDTWIYVQEPKIQMGRIQVFNNWSPYLVKTPKRTF